MPSYNLYRTMDDEDQLTINGSIPLLQICSAGILPALERREQDAPTTYIFPKLGCTPINSSGGGGE